MAASEVAICNLALSFLGANIITSLADGTEEAIYCDIFYEDARDAVLAALPWTFARKRQALAESATTPDFGFAHQYPLPGEALYVWKVVQSDGVTEIDEEWQVEGRMILTDHAAPLNVIYVRRVTDTTEYTPNFTRTLAMRIAADLAFPITTKDTLREKMEVLYNAELDMARGIDSMQGTPDSLESDELVDIRL